MQKPLKKYIHAREEQIIKLLRKNKEQYSEEDFHALRVEIKKLKAFFELCSDLLPDFKKKKTLKPFRRLFKRAGSVREIQIEEATLKKYGLSNVLQPYFRKLHKKKKQNTRDFLSIDFKKTRKAISHALKKSEEAVDKLGQDKVKSYLQRQSKNIRKGFNEPASDDKMHQLRMELKDLFYNSKCFSMYPQRRIRATDQFQELIGQWHDSAIIAGQLSAAVKSKRLNPAAKQKIKLVQATISEKKNRLGEKIKKERQKKHLIF